MKRLVSWAAVGMVVLFLAAQAVPYGRGHANAPVEREPLWDSSPTRDLAVRACFDCHSNQTLWPWYSTIAPASWFIQRDVDEGRRYYAVLQRHARLSSADRRALAQGFDATFGAKRTRGGGGSSGQGESH